jgi:hypothetical protein
MPIITIVDNLPTPDEAGITGEDGARKIEEQQKVPEPEGAVYERPWEVEA